MPTGVDSQVIVTPSGAKVKSWDFDELQEMLSDYPNMSVCFHATLASAMASKLVDSHDPSIKYRLLLQASRFYLIALVFTYL